QVVAAVREASAASEPPASAARVVWALLPPSPEPRPTTAAEAVVVLVLLLLRPEPQATVVAQVEKMIMAQTPLPTAAEAVVAGHPLLWIEAVTAGLAWSSFAIHWRL